VLRELSDPQGGFYSSLDADSEGEEGKFYAWTTEEINRAIRDDSDIDFFTEAYGITQGGNFEGKTVLQRKLDDQTLSERFGMSIDKVEHRLTRLHQALFRIRSANKTSTDDK
jgi:uncharacterized protein YyaL (SSP411 family)